MVLSLSVGQKPLDPLEIGAVHQASLAQVTLAFAGLGGQLVALAGLVSFDLALAGDP